VGGLGKQHGFNMRPLPARNNAIFNTHSWFSLRSVLCVLLALLVRGADGTAGGDGWRRMASENAELVALFPLIRSFMAKCGACLLPGMRPLADPHATTPIKCFEMVGLDLMIEASSSPRVWLLELNSFPAAAPFAQEHGKSAAFHHEQVGFCAALQSLVLADHAQLLGGVSRLDDIAKWRVVAEEKHTQF
jgi:hypothetical protein